MRKVRSFEPAPGTIYPVSQVDGDFTTSSPLHLFLDTQPPVSVEATVLQTNRGFTRRIMAKVALHTHEGEFLARINVLSDEPHKGTLSIDKQVPN